jgi:hypothetical protein
MTETTKSEQCCACLAIVPWLYLDVCADCIRNAQGWTPQIREQYRVDNDLAPYGIDVAS